MLALVAQASDFGTPFTVLSVGLTAALYLLGILTGVRVLNASLDDASYVLGMNRLREAYRDIDPGIERYLITGWTDDQAGLMATSVRSSPTRREGRPR